MKRTVDARGLACPQPVVLTSRAIPDAAEVTVIVDNAVAAENVSRFARSKGYSVERAERQDGIWLELRRTAGAVAETRGAGDPSAAADRGVSAGSPEEAAVPAGASAAPRQEAAVPAGASAWPLPDAPELLPCSLEPARGPLVLLVTHDAIGAGPAELGERLMAAFLHTLLEASPAPATIVLMNRGVFLTAEGSRSLDDLAALAQRGAEVLSCGTCLGYFGLTEKLAVGRVSNMFEIASILLSAGRLVTL